MFRAIDDEHGRVAACKVVNLFISPTLGYGAPNVKELQKEVQVHKSLKHGYILEFLHSETFDKEQEREGFVPGLYILLELAIGGDLFDKIGAYDCALLDAAHLFKHRMLASRKTLPNSTSPKWCPEL